MLSNSREDNVLSLTELSLDDNELKISEYFFGRMLNDTNESTCEDIDDVAEFQLVPKIVSKFWIYFFSHLSVNQDVVKFTFVHFFFRWRSPWHWIDLRIGLLHALPQSREENSAALP